MIFAPWCAHCKKVIPVWEELAVSYINNPELMIAKIDGDTNEAKGLVFESFPTLIYYPKGNKRELQAYKFKGDHSLENFTRFLYAQGHNNGAL